MQQTVPVVSTSPPNVMAATKSVAPAAAASGQEPFNLILQKTSENLDQKGNSRVRDREEPTAIEQSSANRSDRSLSVNKSGTKNEVNQSEIDNQKLSFTKEESSTETEKVDDLSTNPVVQEMIQLLSLATTSTNTSTEIVEDQPEDVELASEATVGIALAPVDDELTSQNVSVPLVAPETISQQPNAVVETSNKPDNAVVPGNTPDMVMTEIKATAEDPSTPDHEVTESNKDLQPKSNTTESMNFNLKEVGQNKNETINDQNLEVEISQEHKTTTSNESQIRVNAQNPESVTGKYQSPNKPEISIDNLSSLKVEQKSDAAPPDIPKVTENTVPVSNVTNPQIAEPARLAEAPKNEVVINQVVNQLGQMVHSNRSTLRVQLYPEELGHIDLKVVTTKAGIDVTMIADRASTQEVLKSEMNSLKQNMHQAGIQLSDLNIGQRQNSNHQQLFDEKQSFSASGYQPKISSDKESIDSTKQVQLRTSAIDYRV